jgi:teichuronic acid biosynthesis glycosyltransferase TuaH
VTIENGVDVDAFRSVDAAAMPTDVTLEPPVAGLVGHISDRIDLDILEAVAESGVSLLLIGPISHTYRSARFESLLRRDNVQWVGPKPFEALASYMRVIDVGLLPYGDTSFNRASFPLKVLEYLAAGRRVVATDLPAVRSMGPVVRRAHTPAEFAREVERALAEAPDASATDQRRSVAEAHSWDRVTLRFLQAVGLHDEA